MDRAAAMEPGCWEDAGEEAQVSLDEFRQFCENDKHWAARREFITRHMAEYPGNKIDQLLALSMVWSNIVFVGNRFGQELTEKVHKMAEGIDIGETPSFELVPGAKATKRPSTSEDGGQPKKKFVPRPRFAPVHFIESTEEDDKQFQVTEKRSNDTNSQEKTNPHSAAGPPLKPSGPPGYFARQRFVASTLDKPSNDLRSHENTNPPHTSNVAQQDCDMKVNFPMVSFPDMGDEPGLNFMTRMNQDYSAMFESHGSDLSRDFRSKVLDTWKNMIKQGRTGIGFVKPPKKTFGSVGRQMPISATPDFFHRLADCLKNTIQDEKAEGNTRLHYTQILSQCLQACKTNPEYIYCPLKEIPACDRPKLKTLLSSGFACEVRCLDVYLATGYSLTKLGARDHSAEQAVKLLVNSKVKVIPVQRKLGHGCVDDMVVCPIRSTTTEFPPALKQEQKGQTPKGISTKLWTELVLVEKDDNPFNVLTKSASLCKMNLEFRSIRMPGNSWGCGVYVQDHCVAEAWGTKKSSKHDAARQAVNVFRNLQSNQPEPGETKTKDIVICQTEDNAISTLNATAQFNKIPIEFLLSQVSDVRWKCQVYIEQELIAESFGNKKTAKQAAAEAALTILKRTQPIVVINRQKAPAQNAISRNQIHDSFNIEANRQKIKSDNIGNQMLRKMGWTGGGLGKGGEGIAEPVLVKERFTREGLGITNEKITKSDIERIIRSYCASENQEDLTFSRELCNEERKHIHLMARKYGLKSKSYGKGTERFLTVSRKWNNKDLVRQLHQEGQIGCYTMVQPSQ